jgi:hypothetical protein
MCVYLGIESLICTHITDIACVIAGCRICLVYIWRPESYTMMQCLVYVSACFTVIVWE